MIAAVIVAAGRSSRMGTSKALLPHLDPGTTFVRYLIQAASNGGAGVTFVVGRPDDPKLCGEVLSSGGVFVANPDAEAGQLSSLLAGLAAAEADPLVAGVLLAPVDVPLITSATIARIIGAAAATRAVIVRATYAGHHGHPVVFKRAVFGELRSADPDVGAKAVVRSNPARVLDVDVEDAGVTMDVDTPADYERLFGRPIGPLRR
jgi:molybdenum cofactor cytidylyltransferase